MNDRVLNEKESLELIAQMIQNTKSRMTRNSGAPFLIWGYTTIIVSLLVWFLLKETGNYHWQWLWFLLPAISLPSTLWIEHKQPKMIKTYIDRIVGYVWAVFGLGGFFVSWVSIFFWNMSVLFVILLIDGNGDGTDGTDYKDEGGDSVRSGGSFGLCGVYLCTRFRPNTGFCVGFCFYDGDTGTLLKRNGKAG